MQRLFLLRHASQGRSLLVHPFAGNLEAVVDGLVALLLWPPGGAFDAMGRPTGVLPTHEVGHVETPRWSYRSIRIVA